MARRQATPTVGLVISGAGARGAYEAGALSVLIPWLRERGEQPRIIVGTSAGAINALLVGSRYTADPRAVSQVLMDNWASLERAAVFRSLAANGPSLALRYLATVARLDRWAGPGVDLDGLLDVEPLHARLRAFPYWDELHQAVDTGALRAVAAVTTSVRRRGTEVFVEASPDTVLPPDDPHRAVSYHATRLRAEHVMASAAIPVLFPPVPIAVDGDGEPDWYVDGGVRQNTPIGPALALGADRLVIVATHPLSAVPGDRQGGAAHGGPPRGGAPRGAPDVFSAAAAVLTSALVDRMIDDVHALDRVNRLVAPARERRGHRAVPYLFVGPEHAGHISAAARDVLRQRYDGVHGLTGGDFTVLNTLVGGPGAAHAELLSFLLFDAEYLRRLLGIGRRDAQVAIRRAGDNPWRLSYHDTFEPAGPSTAHAPGPRVG